MHASAAEMALAAPLTPAVRIGLPDEVFVGVARVTPRAATGKPGRSHVAVFTIEESFRGRAESPVGRMRSCRV